MTIDLHIPVFAVQTEGRLHIPQPKVGCLNLILILKPTPEKPEQAQ